MVETEARALHSCQGRGEETDATPPYMGIPTMGKNEHERPRACSHLKHFAVIYVFICGSSAPIC